MEMRMNERTNEWSPETRFPSFSACWNFSNEPRFYMSSRNFFHSPSLPLLFFLVFFRSAPLSDFRIGLFILNICCISRSAFCFEGLEFFNWNVEMYLIVDLWDESVRIVYIGVFWFREDFYSFVQDWVYFIKRLFYAMSNDLYIKIWKVERRMNRIELYENFIVGEIRSNTILNSAM